MKRKISLILKVTISILLFFSGVAFSGTIPPSYLGKDKSLAPMLEKVIPAVVNISVSKKYVSQNVNPLFNDPFFQEFFKNFDVPQKRQEKTTQSIGSGVIIDAEKGYIITNHHVIEGADEIFITLKDGRKIKATKIGSDPETDLALLYVKEKNLTSIPFADVENLRVGDFVIAIGNPFGLGQTVTSGIVSAVERSGLGIESYENFIQTDASINPGNSGGALININGELVGINTAILSPQKANVGIGFAIPADMVEVVVNQLAKTGKVKRGKIGIYIQDLTPEIATAFAIDRNTKGVLITNVIRGSSANIAGLKQYDIVTSFDGKPVKNSAKLRNFIGITPVGSTIKLGVIRNGKNEQIEIKIGTTKQDSISDAGTLNFKGAIVANINSSHPLFNRIQGVLIVSVKQNSKAFEKGLKANDIITAVNRKTLKSAEELQEIVKQSRDKELLLTVKRKNMFMFILL